VCWKMHAAIVRQPGHRVRISPDAKLFAVSEIPGAVLARAVILGFLQSPHPFRTNLFYRMGFLRTKSVASGLQSPNDFGAIRVSRLKNPLLNSRDETYGESRKLGTARRAFFLLTLLT